LLLLIFLILFSVRLLSVLIIFSEGIP